MRLPVIVVEPDITSLPTTVKVLPSNVKLLSTVAFGAVPFNVINPLSVVPVSVNVPDVPELPVVPLVPADPLVPVLPELPLVPDEPVDPDEPEVPVLPLLPDVPVEPLLPEVPVEPLDPEVPVDPEEPLVPLLPAVPALPEVPVLPLLPAVPDVPALPEVPELPEEPEVPALPLVPVVPELPESIEKLKQQAADIKQEKVNVVKQQRYEEAANLRDKEKRILNKLEVEKKKFEEDSLNNKKEITLDLVYEVVSNMTKIPVTKLNADETKTLFEILRCFGLVMLYIMTSVSSLVMR